MLGVYTLIFEKCKNSLLGKRIVNESNFIEIIQNNFFYFY